MRVRSAAGFTLIESIVFIALFSFLIAGMLSFLLTELNAWGQIRMKRTAVDGATFLLDRLTEEVQLASAIASSTSVFDVSPGHLTLVSFATPTSTATTTVDIFLSGMQLQVERAGAPALGLNAATSLAVNNLIFTRLATTTSQGVRIQLTVQANKSHFTKQETLSTFVILRGKSS